MYILKAFEATSYIMGGQVNAAVLWLLLYNQSSLIRLVLFR